MLYAIVAVICLILDQALKYWTSANIVLNTGTKELIPGVIHLANVHNTGAAFSMLEGARWFFVVLCLAFLVAVVFMLYKNFVKTQPARWMLVIVLAGALGNCIDRIISGYVVDMLELGFKIFGYKFPVFNLADIFITVGGILFCVFFLLEPDEKKLKDTKVIATSEVKAKKLAKPQTVKDAPVKERGEKAEKAEKIQKPLIKRRQKTVIPDFPHHPHVPEPAIDPNDPFAEWERLAAEKANPKAEKKAAAAEDIDDAPIPTILETPVPAAKEDAPLFIDEKTKPAAPKAEMPKLESVKAEAPRAANPVVEEEASYNLDDILAEFKDL